LYNSISCRDAQTEDFGNLNITMDPACRWNFMSSLEIIHQQPICVEINSYGKCYFSYTMSWLQYVRTKQPHTQFQATLHQFQIQFHKKAAVETNNFKLLVEKVLPKSPQFNRMSKYQHAGTEYLQTRKTNPHTLTHDSHKTYNVAIYGNYILSTFTSFHCIVLPYSRHVHINLH